MKFAIINESSKFSGLGRYAIDLTYATSAKLFSLSLDSSIDPSKYPGQLAASKPFLRFGNGWYLNHRFPTIFLRSIKKLIEIQITPETILHYSSQGIPHLNLNNRYVYTVHDLFGLDRKYNNNPRLRKLLESNLKYVLAGNMVIADSKHIKYELENLGGSGKMNVIYPPVSSSFKVMDNRKALRKSFSLPEGKKLVLSVSSQNPRKNLKAVAETMELLGEEYSLVRVGKPIGECYSFSNIDDEKLNMIYNACDVLLFPSLDEGFGYPLAEAMTVGLPAVASDIPVFQEIAENAAVLVEPVPERLARGVKDAIDNSDTFRERGIQMAKRYSFDRFRSDVNALYSGLK